MLIILYIYMLIIIIMRLGREVQRLAKIILRNMTEWGLFFNIVHLVVHTLLHVCYPS